VAELREPDARAIGLIELRALEQAAGEHVSRPDARTRVAELREAGEFRV